MQAHQINQTIAFRAAQVVLAVALAFGAAAVSAQEAIPGQGVRASQVDRSEAERRLVQARRAQARGPDMQQGIPPGVEKNRGDRRRARVLYLQRNVDAAAARVREVYATVQENPV